MQSACRAARSGAFFGILRMANTILTRLFEARKIDRLVQYTLPRSFESPFTRISGVEARSERLREHVIEIIITHPGILSDDDLLKLVTFPLRPFNERGSEGGLRPWSRDRRLELLTEDGLALPSPATEAIVTVRAPIGEG